MEGTCGHAQGPDPQKGPPLASLAGSPHVCSPVGGRAPLLGPERPTGSQLAHSQNTGFVSIFRVPGAVLDCGVQG